LFVVDEGGSPGSSKICKPRSPLSNASVTSASCHWPSALDHSCTRFGAWVDALVGLLEPGDMAVDFTREDTDETTLDDTDLDKDCVARAAAVALVLDDAHPIARNSGR